MIEVLRVVVRNVLDSRTPIAGRLTLVVDGQALVMALGRLSECNTFEDLGDNFVKAVLVLWWPMRAIGKSP